MVCLKAGTQLILSICINRVDFLSVSFFADLLTASFIYVILMKNLLLAKICKLICIIYSLYALSLPSFQDAQNTHLTVAPNGAKNYVIIKMFYR